MTAHTNTRPAGDDIVADTIRLAVTLSAEHLDLPLAACHHWIGECFETHDDRDIDRDLTSDEARDLAAMLNHKADMADRAAGLR